MNIVLKYLFKSIQEKKFRTLIIVLSVTLSTALLFASMALTGTLIKMNTDQIKSQYGRADIMISAKRNQTQPYIGEKKLTPAQQPFIEATYGLYNATGTIKKGTTHKTQYTLSIDGLSMKDLDKLFSVHVMEGSLDSITGSRILIGQRDAQKLNLSLNEHFTIRLAERNYKLTVGAIAESSGPFKPSSNNNIRVITELSDFQKKQGTPSRVTHLLVIKNPAVSESDALKALSERYPSLDVKMIISQAELNQALNGISSSLMVMLSLVVVMGIFIIYTSFKVIALERLPIIGTLRSVGANKWMTDGMLFLESTIYGTVGGLLGLVVGYGILNYFAIQMSANPFGGPPLSVTLVYDATQMMSCVLFALFISLIGSAIPILKVSKYSVKSIILNEIEKPIEKANSPLLGLCLLLVALVGGYFMSGPLALLFDLVALIIISIGMIQMTPWVLEKSVPKFSIFFKGVFGNIGGIAVKNVSGNKSVINNISLLCLGISGMIMINTISTSTSKDMLNEFKKADFEIMFLADKMNKNMEQRIKSTPGISNTNSFYTESNVKINGGSTVIQGVNGVEPKYFEFWRTEILGDKKAALKNFNKDRVMLITPYLQRQLKVNMGDAITIKIPKGTRTYTVAGLIKSIEYNGSYAIIPAQYMKLDFGKKYKDLIYIKTESTQAKSVQETLSKKFQKDNTWVQTIAQLKGDSMKSNEQMMLVLKSFSFISMFIGIFGLLNNVIVSIMSRRQQFAVMRSVGMSKNQLIQLVLLEGLFTGTLGGLLGAITGLLFNQIMIYILAAMMIDMNIYQNYGLYIISIIGAIVITSLASIQPAISTSKASIIESIKFE